MQIIYDAIRRQIWRVNGYCIPYIPHVIDFFFFFTSLVLWVCFFYVSSQCWSYIILLWKMFFLSIRQHKDWCNALHSRLQKNTKAAAETEYPAYGVTGPNKDNTSPCGDRKLAQSAQMYHYQHQKQQMIALEKWVHGLMKLQRTVKLEIEFTLPAVKYIKLHHAYNRPILQSMRVCSRYK